MPKISALTAATALTSDDLFVVVDAPSGTAVTKKITTAIVQRDTQGGVAYTWPAADGSASQVLTTNGAGVLTWAAGGGSIGINDLTDVTITAAASGDLLRYNGSAWVDYPDSNYAAAGHNHSGVYQPANGTLDAVAAGTYTGSTSIVTLGTITTGTFPYANLSGVPATFAPAAHALESHSDVTITAKAAGDILRWNGSAWVDYADSAYAAASHSHTASQITDFDTEVSNNADVAANTGARHAAATVSGSLDYITLTGQDIVRGAIDLATDITLTNLAQFDILYGASATGLSRLGGNVAATNLFLRSVGTGAAAQAPSWEAVTKTDVGLSNVENTALSTWAGSPSIVTLGTITTGTFPYANLSGVPVTFAPAAHTIGSHSDITVTTQALGDLIYASSGSAWVNLAGNTTATKKFLRQTGNGSISAAPAWDTVTATDVGLGSVENTALSTWAGSTAITTLGTIATGVWQGTAVASGYGGTGFTTYATGDIIYASAANTLNKLAVGASPDGYVLTLASGVPSWAAATGGSGAWTHATTYTTLDNAGDNVGINAGASPAAKLHVLATTEQLRLGYDASNYTSFTVASTGALTVTPNGGGFTIAGGSSSIPIKSPSTGALFAGGAGSGNFSTCFGIGAGGSMTSAQNTGIGYNALNAAGSGSTYNVAIGNGAGANLTTNSSSNVLIGGGVADSIGSGANYNVIIGSEASQGTSFGVTTGDYNILIGPVTLVDERANSYQVVLGSGRPGVANSAVFMWSADYRNGVNLTNRTDQASAPVLRLYGPSRATSADNDNTYISWFHDVDDGFEENARIAVKVLDVTTATVDAELEFYARAVDVLDADPSFVVASDAVRVQYDASNTATLGVGSTGLLSITPSGAHANLASGKNLLIGGTTAITTGTNSIGIFTGTAPTAVAADSIALYSSDLTAGNTIPSIWTEGTGIYSAGTPAASTGSIAIRVNGTVYHFTVSTTAAA